MPRERDDLFELDCKYLPSKERRTERRGREERERKKEKRRKSKNGLLQLIGGRWAKIKKLAVIVGWMGRNSDTGSFLLNRGLIPALSRHPVILSRHVTKREIDKRGWWGKRNAVQQEGVDFDGLPLARYLMEFRRISLATFLPWESIVYALDVVVIRDREMHSNLFCFFCIFPPSFSSSSLILTWHD